MIYLATFSVDWTSMEGPVKELFNSLNTTLANCGISERVGYRSKAFSIEAKLERELTNKERSLFMEALEKSVQESLPQYSMKLESFRRKSGNVQQLASSVA